MTDPAQGASRYIVSTTPESFSADVFERSKQVPVVVDFWAEWCPACRALAPILEKIAADANGRFVLVKANTDEVPTAAAEFNVQGIPAVYGVVDGEVVDFFTGALPEPHARAWIERLCGTALLADAKRLEPSAPAEAEAKYRQAIEQSEPRDAAPRIGLARVLLAQEKIDECRRIMRELEDRGFLEPEAEEVKAALELRDLAGGDVEQRRAAAEADPENLDLSLELAEALAGARQFEEALDRCLTIVQRQKTGVGEKARELMVDIFRVLPDESDLATTYRRKLSMAMY